MRYQFRVVTNQRKLYVTAANTTAVMAGLALDGLLPGEKVEAITAYANERSDYTAQVSA